MSSSQSPLSKAIGTYGYVVTFALGIVGHSSSLLTFSQRQLRSTSTTFFFLAMTIFDMLYLFMSLYDFLLINLGVPELSPYYISLCRFRTFIVDFVQTTSAWLFIFVAIDRFIRACLPHRTKLWCTKRNVAIAVLITVVCSTAFNSHVLQNSFGTAFPFSRVICGPSRQNTTDYTLFYYIAWPILQICINILLPALLMIICLVAIYQKALTTGLVRQTQHLQKQMLFIMLSKTILFLICTLPYGVYRLITIYSLDPSNTKQYAIFLVVTALLTILLNANYSLGFYAHCLTSTLFRQTFLKTIKTCMGRQGANIVQPAVCTTAP
jgi:hypothetical protein